ncbi:hypothetical protein R83H12_01631 [Fibrobacteria bacterium R8-3-H12]
MTITEELENIILKYKLDNAYPRFKNYVKCKKIVKKLFSEYAENDKILLLSSEQDSLSFALQEIEFAYYLEKRVVDVLDFEKLNEIDFSSYSDIIIVTQEFYKEISYELSIRKIKHKCLYDYFVNSGIFIDYNYYNIFGGKYMPMEKKDGTNYFFSIMSPSYELFYCYKKYIFSRKRESKQFYLQRIIFLSLYMRDFIATDKFINTYNNNKYENFRIYTYALKSIEKLLNRIKLKLSARKDDCFIFLNDSLHYGNQKYTPFLNSISKNSLHFENAWTTTQYTKPSIKSLMTGKFFIDDRSYEISYKNNLVENLCKERNMQFRYFGILDFEQNTNDNIGWTTPASRTYWQALEYLLRSNIKKFIFTHTLIETHSPCCANNLNKLKNIIFNAYSHTKQQMELSIAYLDKQLKWYSDFFPQNSIKIYMNDHGTGIFPERLHARLDIKAPWIKPRKVDGLFSYSDFHKLVNMLLDKNLNLLDSLFLNHTKNQDLPIYGKLLNTLSSSYLFPIVFGYRAAIAKESIYIKYGDGSEYYRRHKISKHRFSMKELEYLRSVAGDNFLDYKKEEKLKLAKYVFEPLERYNKRNGIYEKKKNQIFLNLLKNFPKEKIIAIRSGGGAGFNLLLRLGIKQQQRISLIIDKNPKCQAAYFGIPVVSPEKAKNFKIDIIIAPQNRENISQEVQKELLAFSKKGIVVDIYEHLAKKGIVCTRSFWEREFLPEDFEQ